MVCIIILMIKQESSKPEVKDGIKLMAENVIRCLMAAYG